MKSNLFVAIVLATAVVASASPVVPKDKRSVASEGITLPLKRNLKTASSNSVWPFQRRQDATEVPAPLHNHDTIFSVSVDIGTPDKQVQLLVDTGSADLWVPSTSCESLVCGKDKVDPSRSSTTQNLDRSYKIEYGDGTSANCAVYNDIVKIAGITATDQTLGLADSVTSSNPGNTETPVGLLGLAFQSISASNSPTFMDTAFQQKQIKNNIFSLYLPPKGEGEITLGGINQDRIAGDMTYAPVTNKTFWFFEIASITFGDAAIGMGSPKNDPTDGGKSLKGIMDSGTSLIILGNEDVKKFYSGRTGAKPFDKQFWSIPCESVQPIDIKLASGAKFSISTDQANLGKTAEGSNECVAAVAGGGADGEVLVGLSFMFSHYVVFDKDRSRIGIAPVKTS